ncbi:histone deacetylation protein Rxt3-domain-containing protein [Exophiala viscosa]|uniref:Histone deacetylation protein Rxt3-domain-containing protein n=2 Tax=Exophiala viscosa TaxID=2486360 RepID=A0AAN6DLD3_9EURO|nr:histone deacetylation protein Rxt3-domain-containing protein [Exophiala viscosa]
MAMPGRSPSYNVPASPPRSFSGYPDPRDPPPMYGLHSRPMLPPSPQHFPPRFSQPPLPGPSPAIAANNGPPHPPQKRPGSSMSISSMLGGEPDRPIQDQYHNHGSHSRTPSRQASGSMSLGTVMSPPQYTTKPMVGEYSYKPRSKTPDRFAGPETSFGARPHRSSSGTMTQRPGPFYESQPRQGSLQGPYPEPRFSPPFGPALPAKDEFDDRTRRTSISGILQRPESQPQPDTTSTFPPAHHPPARPESIPPLFGQHDRSGPPHVNGSDISRPNGLVGSYDTRPPSVPRPAERPAPQSLSPELRRPLLNGNESRPYAAFGHVGEPAIGSHNMMRQDSVQSQSDRSVLGNRLRNRPYSPFAGSVASQSGLLDDSVRKGSDELSQHRAILGLATESKRGRYSPLPQAVQGAQAQTPVLDTGIKTEQGRVFSGIGSGLGTTSANPTPTPQPPSASPFKQNEGGARLSEENLMKMSRSASGMSKRNRKTFDDEARAESDVGDTKKTATGRGKRSKYQHSYKLDLEEAALSQRKTTFGTSNHLRRTGTPTSNPSQLTNHPISHRQSSPAEKVPQFRPKKTIRISPVVAQARRNPRRHLGFYKYDPEVTPVDITKATNQKFDVSIRPNLQPAFTDADHVNCTYTIRVPRMWLRHRERGLICAERYFWGSGIYTDDSDPVAAAMHSGFISSVHPAGIDEALLEKVIEEQNPRIEGSPAPETPQLVDENRDLHITLLVLPQLESYVESARFGIKSRSWPNISEPMTSSPDLHNTPHDGVSFMVLKTEFVDDGIEVKRVGRTGKEKRERLRRELMERKRALELEKEKLAKAAIRVKERKDAMRRKNYAKKSGLSALEDSSTAGRNGTGSGDDKPLSGAAEQENAPVVPSDKRMELDVGQSPGDWIRQLAVAAA